MKDQIPEHAHTHQSTTHGNESEKEKEKTSPQRPEQPEEPLGSIESTSISPAVHGVPDMNTTRPGNEQAPPPPQDEAALAVPALQIPTPTPTTHLATMPAQPLAQLQQRRQAPIWIDALIVAGMAVLVTLLYRKISNPSNLIETVSL